MSTAKRASVRTKRLPYVSKNTGNAADYKASNGDVDEEPSRKKVRKELSVWELKKDSECFARDEDHIYSKEQGQEDVKMSKKFKCDRLPTVYLTRSSAFVRSQNEDLDVVSNDDEEDNPPVLSGKRQRCFSKNAINARLNREKKKQYISSLESIKDNLLKENQEMTRKVNSQEKMIAALQYEVRYLKSLLANSKEISEILKSLTESTGLPVSSSLQSLAFKGSDETGSNNINTFQRNVGDQVKTLSQTRQPLSKKVTSGTNFPILQNDVNLGHFDSRDEEELLNQGCEELDPSLSPVSDLSWDSVFLNDCNYDLNFSLFDYPIYPAFSSETENITQKNEPSVINEFEDIDKNESNVGLCLHVNKKKISVELCSLCNTRAQIKRAAGGDVHWMNIGYTPFNKCKRAICWTWAGSVGVIAMD